MSIGAEMYGTFLTPIVLSEIPEDFRVMLSRKLDEDTWDLSAVIKVFRPRPHGCVFIEYETKSFRFHLPSTRIR